MSENDTSCEETPVDLPEDDNDFHKGEEEEENQKKTRSNESAVWEFFTKVPPFSSKQAKCDICRETKSYKSCTTNLKNHLKNRHEKSYNKYLNVVKMKRCERSVSGKGPVRDRSIWRYFTGVSGERKRAKCKFCDKKLSYRSTIANLKTHLAVKHYDLIDDDIIGKSISNYKSYKNRMIKPAEKYPKTTKKAKLWQFVDFEQENAYGDEINHDTSGKGSVQFSSEIWRHFDVEEDEAICGLCRETVPVGLKDMKNHLGEKHSEVLDDLTHKVLDAASEEDNELGDDMYTEVVYIENEDKNMSNTEKHSKTVKQKKAKVKIERNSSTSSDDILVKSRHKRFSKEPDELESFFNYIKVLLKKVPKEASQKLHLDIIKLIMNATQPENNVINNVSLETGYLNSANTNMLLDKNIVLTQNNTTASDVNCLNTQKIMLVPVQNITTRNIEKNTSQVVTIPNTSINISSGINTSNGISKSVTDTTFDKQIR